MVKVALVLLAFASPFILATVATAQQNIPLPQQPRIQPQQNQGQFQQPNVPGQNFQQPQGQGVPQERYRARITGTGQDGGPIAINTTNEWPSRDACMSQAGAAYPGQVLNALAQSGVAKNLNLQCRKMPSRTTNLTPNVPGGQGTSTAGQEATAPVFGPVGPTGR